MENFNSKILIFSFVLFLIFCLNAFSKSNIAIIDAAGRGDINKVKELINSGANINQQDRIGENALIEAAEGGHIEVVKLLIENKVNLNLKSKWGRTALMRASSSI